MFKQHRTKILHVDDNETNRYVVSRMLQNTGFEITQAATGEACLQLLAQQEIALVILDVKLPDIDGFEVCRRIKANPTTSFIPILHLSAKFVKSEDKAHGLEGGADAYLAQPVEPIELIATIKALLRIREAEESALNLAREWQTTFDAIADGVCLLDREGKVVRCNKKITQILGKADSEINDDADRERLQSILTEIQITPFSRLQKTQRRESLETYLDDRWFSVTADPVFDRQGKFSGAVCIICDITDRVKTQEALRASEERFRMLLENVEDYAIFFLDTEGRTIGWNAGAERILGYRESEIMGRSFACIFTPEELASNADKQQLSKAILEGRAENECWYLRKDGSRFWASGILTPLKDDKGKLRGFAKIMRDFTARKQAEDERAQLLAREQEARAQAESANRMKDEFLATLSHELRSPLNAMLGWAQLLNSRKFDRETTEKALDIIERTARTQAQLVDDLLDVSRIIQGKLLLNIRPIELTSIIGAVMDSLRPAIEAKKIQIQTILDPQAGMVAGDSDRLQQVIWNLLSNAIKFTPVGGQVEVRLEQKNAHVQITVSDTGKGINPEFVPYVFDRFRQADSSMTRAYNGLGLGLAIVRHLVELHGGTVDAHSDGEGLGATFMVKLPVVSIPDPSADREFELQAETSVPDLFSTHLDGLQVLVVDDDFDSLLFVGTVLEECGASVIRASSCTQAIELIKQFKPNVLLSDIGMPEEDGYSLIRKVRALTPEQGGRTPAAALTAYARAEDRTRSLLEGFQIHISKPIEPTELVAVVANLAARFEGLGARD